MEEMIFEWGLEADDLDNRKGHSLSMCCPSDLIFSLAELVFQLLKKTGLNPSPPHCGELHPPQSVSQVFWGLLSHDHFPTISCFTEFSISSLHLI